MPYEPEDYRDDPDHDAPNAIWIGYSMPVEKSEKATLHATIAQRRVAVRSIHLPFEPQQDFVDALEEIRCGAEALRQAGLGQPAVALLGGSFSGKSSEARIYADATNREHGGANGEICVVYAKLDPDGTIGSLAGDILAGLGAIRPMSLTAAKRWDRARNEIRNKRVSVVILDEFQRANRRPTISPIIAAKILDIMDDGDCAVAFVGKQDAKSIFDGCPDLKNRLDSPVWISPLRWDNDSEAFMKFVDEFDQALVDADITDFKSGFAKEDVAQLLLESANGLIGQFSRIIETAVIAITREGHRIITRQDLSNAVDDWSIANERIGYNPFIRAGSVKNPAFDDRIEEQPHEEDPEGFVEPEGYDGCRLTHKGDWTDGEDI